MQAIKVWHEGISLHQTVKLRLIYFFLYKKISLFCWRWTLSTWEKKTCQLEMNFWVLEINTFYVGEENLSSRDEFLSAGDELFENASSNFIPKKLHIPETWTELSSRLLHTEIHPWKRAVAIMLSCSPPSTLHPQVIDRIAFSIGLLAFK